MKEKNGVVLYKSLVPVINTLTDEQAGILFRATLRYAFEGEEPAFNDQALVVAWVMFQDQLDRGAAAYEKKCETNQYNAYYGAMKKKGETPLSKDEWRKQRTQPNATERCRTHTRIKNLESKNLESKNLESKNLDGAKAPISADELPLGELPAVGDVVTHVNAIGSRLSYVWREKDTKRYLNGEYQSVLDYLEAHDV